MAETLSPFSETPPGGEPDRMGAWSATVEGGPEPALLCRILQRLMVQGAVLDTLRYRSEPDGPSVRVEILFQADEAHARLLAKRWEQLVDVVRVELCPATIARRHRREEPGAAAATQPTSGVSRAPAPS